MLPRRRALKHRRDRAERCRSSSSSWQPMSHASRRDATGAWERGCLCGPAGRNDLRALDDVRALKRPYDACVPEALTGLVPKDREHDLGIDGVQRRLAFLDAGSGLLGCVGPGQQPKVDGRSFDADSITPDSAICRRFVMGRVGIEPTTLGLRVDAKLLNELESPFPCTWLSQISSVVFARPGVSLLTFC